MNKPIVIAGLDANESIAKQIAQMLAVATKMMADIDTDIVDAGTLLKAESEKLQGKLTTQIAASAASLAATKAVHMEEKVSIKVYETSTNVLEVKFPGADNTWLLYAVKNTLPGEKAATLGPVLGGSVVQSPFAGKGIMHFHHLKGAKFYKVMETIGDVTDPTSYYPANPDTFDSSVGGEIIPKHPGTLTNWIVIGHNGAGDGVPSAPFGFTVH
jgi:hypothetical protein